MLFLFLIKLALLGLGFLLAPKLRPCGRGAAGAPLPTRRLSVIIPARNEAHNLPRLLASLAAQAPAPAEIIVVDDGSTDATARVAREGGATVLTAAPLPAGWKGKTWALHQGVQLATGDHFLFLDADTWFEAGGLARAWAEYGGGAFSVGPWHAVDRWHEDLSLFFNLNMIFGTVPQGLFGQMLLVDRASYERVGGHAAVQGRVLENFALAEHFRNAGVPVRSVAGRGVISFRMYPGGIGELVEGWTKGFAAGAGRTPPWVMALVVGWMVGLLFGPPGGLPADAGWKAAWAGAYLLGTLQLMWFARQSGNFRRLTSLFYPLPLLFFLGLFTRSALRSGQRTTWKGRDIRAD